MDDALPFPPSFWIEIALLSAAGLALWLAVISLKRAQSRHRYRAWQGRPVAMSNRPTARDRAHNAQNEAAIIGSDRMDLDRRV
jgi:hypothetical protein